MVLNVITPRWPDGRKSFSQSGATEEAGCWWQQRCDPRSCSLYEGKKELLGTKFWLKNHRLQPVVETNHPPIEVFFFFFLWMTGHLWCHASTGRAFLLDRNWCHGLSDRGLSGTQGTFCDINKSLSLWAQTQMKESDSNWKDKAVVKKWREFGRATRKKCGLSVQLLPITCPQHGLVMYCHMCLARAPPTTCCSSRVLFLSWEDVCHCGEIL